MKFSGKTKISGKKIGTIGIIVSDEKLLKLKNRNVRYRLELFEESKQEQKTKSHKVKYIQFNPNIRQHLFEVTSGESGEKYLCDVSLGCGCNYGSNKGIATGKICTHLRQVLKKMVM